jgi:hypothetical protein
METDSSSASQEIGPIFVTQRVNTNPQTGQ